MDEAGPATPLHELEAYVERMHAGQVDKAGAPYHLHPKRVRRRLCALFPDATLDEQAAALCHDVLEDTGATAADLRRAGLSPAAVRIVEAVTRGAEEDYAAFILRVARAGRGAMRVKIADLADNADESRLAALPEAQREALRERIRTRYLPALATVRAALEAAC